MSARAGSCREFTRAAASRERGAAGLRGRCLPYGDGITYWPLAEILKAQAGVLDTDATASSRSRRSHALGDDC